MVWPSLIAVLVFTEASGLVEVNIGLAAGLCLVWLVGPRIETDILAEVAIVATTVTGAFFTVSSQVPEAASWRGDQLDGGWVFIALIGLYTSLAWQLLKSPRGGHRASAALNLVAVLACGSNEEFRMVVLDDASARSQLPYLFMVVVFGWAQFDALRRLDPVWHRVPSVGRRTVVVFVLTILLAAPAIWGIPILHAALIDYARTQWKESRTGFSEHTELGELRGMLLSDRVILRVDGVKPSYLRGVVYDRYIVGRWIAPMRTPSPPQEWESDTEPETVIHSVSGARDRYFLPFDLEALTVSDGLAAVDDTGIFTAPSRSAGRVELTVGKRGVAPVAGPSKMDLDVPAALSETLDGWLAEHLEGHNFRDPEATVVRIAEILRTKYKYALEFSRDPEADPVADFLHREQRGHCEYFASAMTLLARSAQVPARMVAGYRVSEWNPVGQYHIVRSRNAHAWTEVYYGGQWHTVDATAVGSLPMPSETPILSAVWDTTKSLLNKGIRALSRLEWWAVAGLLGALFLIWALLRWRRHNGGSRARGHEFYSQPLPAYNRLARRLEKLGLVRKESESISDYVDRIEKVIQSDSPLIPALKAYTAFRYGKVGNPREITARLQGAEAWVRSQRRGLRSLEQNVQLTP
jgi:hypothetical protein